MVWQSIQYIQLGDLPQQQSLQISNRKLGFNQLDIASITRTSLLYARGL